MNGDCHERDREQEPFILVSNREPYVHKRSGLSIKVEKPAGGLTSAMDDVLRATGGTWVAWGSGSADRDVVDGDNRILVPPEDPSYILKRVWLSPSEVDNYYHGYANQVLWPLCHITLDRVYFRKRFWEDYVRVNQAFAEAVTEEADEHSIIWIHDYHLCILPQLIRAERPHAAIAHFWHIPWPDWSVFRVCPQAKEILEGLLGNDLIGFQIPLFIKNFINCVRECLDAEIDYHNSRITYKGHLTRLKSFPISIDFERFNTAADSPRTTKAIRAIKERYGITGEFIGIGVDRLEYTKALIKRLQAIDLFFKKYERFRGKFTFIQIAVPTRMKEPYISYKESVEELIKKINGKYSFGKWQPLIYIDSKVEQKDLAAYYRMADLAIISSVYDGMNLVAKEYAAAQVDEKGVLILSELAGAADELEGAILVNPYDVEEFANCIRQALGMSQQERTGRMAALRRQIKENNLAKWVSDVLSEIKSVSAASQGECRSVFDHWEAICERLRNEEVLLLLDYDGTLSPIVETPDKAHLPDEMRDIVNALGKRVPTAIISGRSLDDLRKRIGIEGIYYIGNHGAEIWNGGRVVIDQRSEGTRARMGACLEELGEALKKFNGVLIEDKGLTASVHFRKLDPSRTGEFFAAFTAAMTEYESVFRITTGKKVLEIRPPMLWNKGDAVRWLLNETGDTRFPVYIGDDTTDMDALDALKGKGMGIFVGMNADADYCLKTQGEVGRFLRKVLELWTK